MTTANTSSTKASLAVAVQHISDATEHARGDLAKMLERFYRKLSSHTYHEHDTPKAAKLQSLGDFCHQLSLLTYAIKGARSRTLRQHLVDAATVLRTAAACAEPGTGNTPGHVGCRIEGEGC